MDYEKESRKALAKEQNQRQKFIADRIKEKKAAQKPPPKSPPWTIPKVTFPPITFPPRTPPERNHAQDTVNNETWQPRREGLFGRIDEFQQSVPRVWYVRLMLVGGICGYIFGTQAGGQSSGIGFAIAGAVAGLLLIPLLAFAVKIVTLSLIIGSVALLIYLIAQIK